MLVFLTCHCVLDPQSSKTPILTCHCGLDSQSFKTPNEISRSHAPAWERLIPLKEIMLDNLVC